MGLHRTTEPTAVQTLEGKHHLPRLLDRRSTRNRSKKFSSGQPRLSTRGERVSERPHLVHEKLHVDIDPAYAFHVSKVQFFDGCF